MVRTHKSLVAALSGAAIIVAGVGVPLAAAPAAAADPAPHGDSRRLAAERARLPGRLGP